MWITFSGLINEPRIYSYARTADEIRLDYQAGYATHLGPSGKTCSEDPASCMDQGLVGNWGMDEGAGQTAFDASGNSNNGRLGSSSTADTADPKWTKGKNGGGLSFDGVNDYVNCGNAASLNITEAITVEAWVKTTDTGAWFKTIVAKYGFTFVTPSWGLGFMDTNMLGFFIRDSAGVIHKVKATTNEGRDGNWHHLVGTADSSNVRFYMDGVLKESVSRTAGDITNDRPVLFARHITTYFNGLIDSVRIYNRALTAEEVRYHYNRRGPVAEWKFDEGSGTKAFDSTENNNDGTLVGATHLPTWTAGKYGSALSFDGTEDYVDCGAGSSLNITGAITVEAWVKTTNTGTNALIFKGASTPNYAIDIGSGAAGNIRFFGYQSDDTYRGIADVAGTVINDGIFHHIVGTFDGTNWFIYVDGKKDRSKVHAGTLAADADHLKIGVRSVDWFNGSIDEVRIYNYARTPSQILTDYNAGVATHLK